MQKIRNYFTTGEKILWITSAVLVVGAYAIFDRGSILTLIASLIGVTSLLFAAKGNALGQLLMVIFSLLYGYISYSFAYYGEMATYLGMTMPMALLSMISWLRHPYEGQWSRVQVGDLSKWEALLMIPLTAGVTIIFYFILRYFHTANLLPSTLSVTTSFAAVYLTFRRSPYYALCYAANDIVLIILWTLAALTNPSYISVIICFAVFLVNDIYGYLSWQKMK